MNHLNLSRISHKKREKHILIALETLYNQGIQAGKLGTALRCLEVLAKRYSNLPTPDAEVDLSPQSLDRLLKALQHSMGAAPSK